MSDYAVEMAKLELELQATRRRREKVEGRRREVERRIPWLQRGQGDVLQVQTSEKARTGMSGAALEYACWADLYSSGMMKGFPQVDERSFDLPASQPRKERMIDLDIGYRADLEWLVWKTKLMEDSLSRAETVTEELADSSMEQLEATRRSVMEMAAAFQMALDAQARIVDDYEMKGEATGVQRKKHGKNPSLPPTEHDGIISSSLAGESHRGDETGTASRVSHLTQSIEDVDSSYDSPSLTSQSNSHPPQELASSLSSSWDVGTRSTLSWTDQGESSQDVTSASTYSDEPSSMTSRTTSMSTSTSTSTIQDLADTREAIQRRAVARQQRGAGPAEQTADSRLVSRTGIPLTIGYIPAVVPIEMSRMLQSDSDRMFDTFQSKIDRSLALQERVDVLDQLDSAFAQTLSDDTITRRVDKKPPATITLFLEGRHEKVKVNPDEIHGSISTQRDDDGTLHTVYNPIGLSDLQRGVSHEDLLLCPPEMQRVVKLRSALLSRRVAEMRQLETWLREETAVLEVLKEEFGREVDNTRYQTKKLTEMEETLRDKPLQRENMKKQIQHDMSFYHEALQRCQRKNEEVEEQSRKTVEIRERFCHVRKMLLQVTCWRCTLLSLRRALVRTRLPIRGTSRGSNNIKKSRKGSGNSGLDAFLRAGHPFLILLFLFL
eukprot:749115-Hanusia_phi.AAC.3